MSTFSDDILQGLRLALKQLPSKYFYDKTGDKIFQAIMHSPEYYLTACEYEIFQRQCGSIADLLLSQFPEFDLVELGAGDCFKSKALLRELLERRLDFTFFPIDISNNTIDELSMTLPVELPGLIMTGMNGEYFPMLQKVQETSSRPKVLLFLGSNIGNMTMSATTSFLRELRCLLRPGDMALIGFDLKKDPHIILSAYNDQAGLTRAFNLNLLDRINRELDADFNPLKFTHFPVYDPESGNCKSFLISLFRQDINLKALNERVRFKEAEPILMEISRKYAIEEIRALGVNTGFEPLVELYDSRHWFTDVIWKRTGRES